MNSKIAAPSTIEEFRSRIDAIERLDLEPWRAEPAAPELQASLQQWRGIYEGENV